MKDLLKGPELEVIKISDGVGFRPEADPAVGITCCRKDERAWHRRTGPCAAMTIALKEMQVLDVAQGQR